ncbi:PH domain-containing protein [Streptomyces sp. PTY087I2]|uniref:PH domain-containing protein n=1 Tax=Streptomyces sp. PTY087I2 TaxID=1819298 RepID=UPI00080BBB6F|nr:PH domain-containing protein [Streptomyces sp. PTY087I2]OCC11383.1 hypothetical protein A3Q37_02579 [Streptomyces sp. PTY087I2]
MHDIEYIPAQKRTWWIWSGVATVLALYTLYASTVGRRPDTSIGSLLVALGWMAIPAAPWLAWMALGRTRINTDGIQVVRPLRSRTARWHEISAIDVDQVGGYGGRYDYWIRISCHSGTSFRLPAPMTSHAGRDPLFDERLQEIRHRWSEAHGPTAREPE